MLLPVLGERPRLLQFLRVVPADPLVRLIGHLDLLSRLMLHYFQGRQQIRHPETQGGQVLPGHGLVSF
jgi:hypothetical protein